MIIELKNLDADKDTDIVTIEVFGVTIIADGVPKVIRKGLKWHFKGHGYWLKRNAVRAQKGFVVMLAGLKLQDDLVQTLGGPKAPERGLYGHNVKEPRSTPEKGPNKRKDLN